MVCITIPLPAARVVKLEVPVAVPGEGRDAIALYQAQGGKRLGEAPGARVRLAVRITVHVAFDAARHDLGVAVVPVGVADQVRHQQRRIHHQSKHRSPPAVFFDLNPVGIVNKITPRV